MERFVRDYAREFRLLEAKPKQGVFAHWWQHGLPVNVLPYENAVGLAQPKMQFWANCCATLRFLPINELLVTDGATAFLHGQRASDNAPSQKHHQSIGSSLAATVEIAGPLWEWADADVDSHIGRHDLKLPVQYHGTKGSSLECAVCPAFHGMTDRHETTKLAPALAKASEGINRMLMQQATSAIQAIHSELSAIPAEDRAGRWQAALPLMAAALEYDNCGRKIEDVGAAYVAGDGELFTSANSALLAKCEHTQEGRMLDLFLVGGELREIEGDLIPQAEIWGKVMGCTLAVIGGRRGWGRALRRYGYVPIGRSEKAYSWVAVKALA
jgi:3'-phosphoadenosine 5'-phosphosulfate sulfotransferase (PAPS reductase)/FAD synthetase